MGKIIEIMSPQAIHFQGYQICQLKEIIEQQSYLETMYKKNNPKKGTFEKNYFRGKKK